MVFLLGDIMHVTAGQIRDSVTRSKLFRVALWIVVALTPFGFGLTTFLLLEANVSPNRDGLIGFAWFMIFLGVIAWGIVISLRSRIFKVVNAQEALKVHSDFKRIQKMLREWVSDYRRLDYDLRFAEFQVENCKLEAGVFLGGFSNGLNVHKFRILQNGELIGSTEQARAKFTDNTSIQTFVSSSNTSGKITQHHNDPRRFDLDARTSNNISSVRTGQAYVDIEGPTIIPTTFAFSDPNEAYSCSNLVNLASAEFNSNFESRRLDLDFWVDRVSQHQDEMQRFRENSAEFRAAVAAFGDEIIYQEYARGSLGTETINEDELDIIKAN